MEIDKYLRDNRSNNNNNNNNNARENINDKNKNNNNNNNNNDDDDDDDDDNDDKADDDNNNDNNNDNNKFVFAVGKPRGKLIDAIAYVLKEKSSLNAPQKKDEIAKYQKIDICLKCTEILNTVPEI